MEIKTYSELCSLNTFDERFDYLKLDGKVGAVTFGYDRYFNQGFYSSPEWKRIRREVIVRDNGCDLGIEGFEIFDHAMIHHMNPITKRDIIEEDWDLLTNPEYLITVSFKTHQAIHFGDKRILPRIPVERKAGDTCPWR